MAFIYKISLNLPKQGKGSRLNKYVREYDSNYIGSSTQESFNKRYPSGIENTHNPILKASIDFFGKNNFKVEILKENIANKDVIREEIKYIEKYSSLHPSGYNLRKESERDYVVPKRYYSVPIRNILTNHCFDVNSLKAFCANPAKYDKTLHDKRLKINYTQMSNCLTGYIQKEDGNLKNELFKMTGIEYPSKIIISETYCPAKYSLEQINLYKKHCFKGQIIKFCSEIKYPFTLINIKTIERHILLKPNELIDFCTKESLGLGDLKLINKRGWNSKFSKETEFKNTDWYKYDEKGDDAIFKIYNQKGDEESFTWKTLSNLAFKMFNNSSKTESEASKIIDLKKYSNKKDLVHGTFGKMVRNLMLGKVKRAYKWRVKEQALPFKMRILRFINDKQIINIRENLKHEVVFKNLPSDNKKEIEITKRIFKLLEI